MTTTTTHPALCDLLAITYPICQAGMGHVARSALPPPSPRRAGSESSRRPSSPRPSCAGTFRRVLDLTDKPFGVDILLATVRAAGEEADRFTDTVRAWTDVALEARVPVLIAGLGNPGPATAEAHRQGMKVMALCGNVKQARDHGRNGVDVVQRS